MPLRITEGSFILRLALALSGGDKQRSNGSSTFLPTRSARDSPRCVSYIPFCHKFAYRPIRNDRDSRDSLRSLFSATLAERGDSYVIEIPRTEVERDAVSPGDTYRVGILSPIETDSQPSNDDTQTAKMSDSRAQDESDDKPPVEEGEVREVTIEATGDQGDGIAKVDQGYVIIVPGGYPSETLSVEIDTVRPNGVFGHALRGDSDG